VKTVVAGRVTSDTLIDKKCMVIQASTPDRDLYVLPWEKFRSNWDCQSGTELVAPEKIGSDSLQAFVETFFRQQRAQGFKLFSPNPKVKRWMYKLTEEDIRRHLSTGYFQSSWGAMQPVKAGDYLAMPPAEDEIYLMPPEILPNYVRWVDGPTRSKNRSHSGKHFLTQTDIMEIFGWRIQMSGTLMIKTGVVIARCGVKGETISTCIQGRVISNTVVVDETSMVVRSSTPDHDLYVLTGKRFLEQYMPDGEELSCSDSDPVVAMLQCQGFKTYKPNRSNVRWVCEVTEEDMQLLVVTFFETKWGALQNMEIGDFLAMPFPEVDEIYLMPREVVKGGTYDVWVGCASEAAALDATHTQSQFLWDVAAEERRDPKVRGNTLVEGDTVHVLQRRSSPDRVDRVAELTKALSAAYAAKDLAEKKARDLEDQMAQTQNSCRCRHRFRSKKKVCPERS